jgi:hypothetical protein
MGSEPAHSDECMPIAKPDDGKVVGRDFVGACRHPPTMLALKISAFDPSATMAQFLTEFAASLRAK